MQRLAPLPLAILLAVAFGAASQCEGAGAAIRILADGSVHPPGAPVQRSGDVYVLAGNVDALGDGIIIERSHIVLEGGGHLLRGSGAGRGVVVEGATGVRVRGLVVTGFEYGVLVNGSPGCTVEEVVVEGGRVGIGVWSSPNCTVVGSVVRGSMVGIFLEGSSGARIAGNAMRGCGIYVRRSLGNTVRNNTVNGRPVAYLEGASGVRVSGDYGQVLLVRCRDVLVEQLSASATTVAVLVSEGYNVTVSGVRVADSVVGIDVWESTAVTVEGCTIAGGEVGVRAAGSSSVALKRSVVNKSAYGVYIDSSTEVSVEGTAFNGCAQAAVTLRLVRAGAVRSSLVVGNARGIVLLGSEGVEVLGNAVWRNGYGIVLNSSKCNSFSSNEFVENSLHVLLEDGGPNSWDGNFWSELWGRQPTGVGGYVIGGGNIDGSPRATPELVLPLEVTTPIGVASGSGWYLKGSTATVSVWPSNLVFLTFDRWVDREGRIVATTPQAAVTVTAPLQLEAVWRLNTAATLAAVLLSLLLYLLAKLRRRRGEGAVGSGTSR